MPHYSEFLIEKSDTTSKAHYSEFLLDEEQEKKSFFDKLPNVSDFIRNKLWQAKKAIGPAASKYWELEKGIGKELLGFGKRSLQQAPEVAAGFLEPIGTTAIDRAGEMGKRQAEMKTQQIVEEVRRKAAGEPEPGWREGPTIQALGQIPFAGVIPRAISDPKTTLYEQTMPSIVELSALFGMARAPFRGRPKPQARIRERLKTIEELDIGVSRGRIAERLRQIRDMEVGPKSIPRKGPEEPTMLYSGVPVPEAIAEISRLTNELIQKAKGPPEVRAGVKQAKQSMIEHDRQIRSAEWTSKNLNKVIKDVVPDKGRQMEMVHAYEQKMRGAHWENLTDLEKSMVQWIGKEKAKLNRFIRENEVLEMMPESENINHIFHHWINPKSGKPFESMYGKFSKGLPQAKQRVIPSYEVGIEKGFKPATTNIGKLVGMEWEAATRAHQSRSMFKTLHQVGAEKDVTIQLVPGKTPKPIRMVERWDLLEKQGLTDKYTRYSHYALDKAITFKDINGKMVRLKGAVGVRKELFPFVKAYLENPSYGAFSKLNFAAKSLKLGLSAFHIMSLGMQEAANWRVPFANIPRGLKAIKSLNPQLRLLHQEGLDLFKGYEDFGYRNKFFEGSNVWGKMGNVVTKPIEGMRTFIFDVVQPGMKASFALDKYQKLLPKYLKRGLTKEECARECVRAADGHFSHEHWKRSLLETNRTMVKLYFMPEARKFWQSILLSPTWQREHLLVAKDVMKSFMPDKAIKKLGMREIGPIKAEYRKYLYGGILLMGAADLYNRFATYTMDGKAVGIFSNPDIFRIRALWNRPAYTVEAKDGTIRTIKGGPAYFRPFKSLYEVAEWVGDPFQKFSYKLSPVMSAIAHQVSPSRYQKDYKGWPSIPDRTWDFITDTATPISWAHVVDYWRGKKEWPDVALPFFGMPTSKLAGAEFKDFYYGQLADIERKHGKNDEWYRIRRSFKFDQKVYKTYKENP